MNAHSPDQAGRAAQSFARSGLAGGYAVLLPPPGDSFSDDLQGNPAGVLGAGTH